MGPLATAGQESPEILGLLPEARLALTQATLYLALAPKSNSVLTAYMAAAKDALETEQQPVPLHLRNAPTSLMKAEGYGRGYQHAHDREDAVVEMECLPAELAGRLHTPGAFTVNANPHKARLISSHLVKARARH